MDKSPGMTIEEAEEAEEDELLGGEDVDPGSSVLADDIDETAEELMTDMKLEDEIDEVRLTEPDFQWSYHIEIYPWTADDLTENFVRLLKIADFSKVFLKKRGSCKENGEPESIDDKLHDRQRKGSIHFYTDNFQNAKNIIRSSTWKAMVSKQLTFEITKRVSGTNNIESAYLEVDTYTACKCRFRDKPKGEFKDRTAKVSGIPGHISLEFLDVVFCRAHAVTGGSTVKEYYKERDGKLQQKLSQIKDFNGSLDFDCLSKGSCRAFVTAHKNVYIENQRISINANNNETMVTPQSSCICSTDKKDGTGSVIPALATVPTESSTKGLNQSSHSSWTPHTIARGGLSVQAHQVGRGGLLRESSVPLMSTRGRGMGRYMSQPQRPISNPTARPGPGMPVPMTGRQKMNEKMRRGNLGPPAFNSMFYSQNPVVPRNAMTSLGESFKQEIASLQKQLQQNTAELEAKIAMLQESTSSGAYFDATEGDWDETAYGEEDEYAEDILADSGNLGFLNSDEHGNYHHSIGSCNAWEGGINENKIPGVYGKAPISVMGPQRTFHTGSFAATQGLIPASDPMQMPPNFTGQMSHNNVAPKFQMMRGQMFQNVQGQMSHIMQGQLPQSFPNQMPQTSQGHISQFAQGEIPGQMGSSFPRQLTSGEISQPHTRSLSGKVTQVGIRPMGPPVPNAHMQIRPQRGAASFQRLRGAMRGKGKTRGFAPSSGVW
ncbi:hypothetical protein PoB_000855700 [Plakobranchus ocellatus]|uniref:Uncharacterized protein n=1 Tax=Plakobranchus ocellatus TaxID=259542 RepID=A0AAV3YGS6_9GAST|nr:hypothetical protein PoB_000855700 [Plakobranchus ocellatus]